MGAWTLAVRSIRGLVRAADAFGATDKATREIAVDPDKWPAETLIHELIHQAGWWIGQDLDEESVIRCEAVITTLIRDNPAVVRWIVDEIAGVAHGAKQGKSSKRKRK